MIHTLGDSHAALSFRCVPGVTTHHIGPVTMARAGHPGDDVIATALAQVPLIPGDVLILCFGEIDVRCHVKQRTDRKPAGVILACWALDYLDRVAAIQIEGVRVGVMSVVPPAPRSRADTPSFPVTGSDEDRAAYTAILNRMLAVWCRVRGLLYLDVYSRVVDEHGLLRREFSDGSVHVYCAADRVTAALRDLWLEE